MTVRLTEAAPVTGGLELDLVDIDGKTLPKGPPRGRGKPPKRKFVKSKKKADKTKRKVQRSRR